MSTETRIAPGSEAAILSRLIRPEDDSLTVEAAEGLLHIRFESGDLARMHELATKHQEGRITDAEMTEMENYRHVGYLLDLLHSKARRSLKSRQAFQ